MYTILTQAAVQNTIVMLYSYVGIMLQFLILLQELHSFAEPRLSVNAKDEVIMT